MDKAELCYSNTNFYNQFFEASSYNVNIDWGNDHDFEIEFSESRTRNKLASINSNKVCWPDGIHGKIVKNCADNLAVPLSFIFKVSYNYGIIPMD